LAERPKRQSCGPPSRPQKPATRAAEALLDGESEQITRKAIDAALGGDVTAIRLCLDRIISPRKDRPINFELPAINCPADAVNANASLVAAVGSGEITPGEAAELGKLIKSYVKSVEVSDLEARISRLEQSNGTAI
jgi:hypothetical protein